MRERERDSDQPKSRPQASSLGAYQFSSGEELCYIATLFPCYPQSSFVRRLPLFCFISERLNYDFRNGMREMLDFALIAVQNSVRKICCHSDTF